MENGSAKLKKRLSADDWGLSPGVNEGILELAKRGYLGSVCLLANTPYLEQGLSQLVSTGVGLVAHVNFTLGRPLAKEAKSLTGREGVFLDFRGHFLRGLRGGILPQELEREARAQISRLQSLVPVEAVNCHQHLHLVPWVVQPLAIAARAAGIRRVRWMEDSGHWPSWVGAYWVAKRYERYWPEAVREPALSLSPTGTWTEEDLLRKLDRSSAQLVIHPAARDDFDQVEFSDTLREPRVREFEALMGRTPR